MMTFVVSAIPVGMAYAEHLISIQGHPMKSFFAVRLGEKSAKLR